MYQLEIQTLILSIPFGIYLEKDRIVEYYAFISFQSLLGFILNERYRYLSPASYLSIPFGIYLSKGQVGIPREDNKLSIPFGIYHISTKQIDDDVVKTFNPFWDLSCCTEGCRTVEVPFFQSLLGFISQRSKETIIRIINLSIPFGIYREICEKFVNDILTFNPFWDLSNHGDCKDFRPYHDFQSLLGFIMYSQSR